MPRHSSILRFERVERGARLVMRGQLLMLRVSTVEQADRGERSLISLFPASHTSFSLGQEKRGEISLIDGLP